VLQVVSGTTSTSVTVSSTTYTDTGLTCTITPSAATSKILILISQWVEYDSDSWQMGQDLRIDRSGTVIQSWETDKMVLPTTSNLGGKQNIVTHTYLDSPATTSSRTYKTQGRTIGGFSGADVFYQSSGGGDLSSIILLEIGV
jgi:hypothetical protein